MHRFPLSPTPGLQNGCAWVKSVVEKCRVPCAPLALFLLWESPLSLPPTSPSSAASYGFALCTLIGSSPTYSSDFLSCLPLSYSYFFSSKYSASLSTSRSLWWWKTGKWQQGTPQSGPLFCVFSIAEIAILYLFSISYRWYGLKYSKIKIMLLTHDKVWSV